MSRDTSPQLIVSRPATSSRRAWEEQANRRIAPADRNLDERTIVFKRNEAITAAYAEMYLRDPQVYKWAGMAALTSATVGRGMYIMRGLRQTRLGSVVGLFGGEVAETFRNLGVGNGAVFTDIYWQHMAYEHGGLAEIEQIFRAGQLDRRALRGWRQIDAGRRMGDQDLIWAGNTALLHFEQKHVLQQQVYDCNPALWREVSAWIPSPIPGHHEIFADFAPDGNIGVFAERWRWITGSMLPRWRELNETQPARVKRLLQSLMLGGDPLALPGLPMLKLRLGVYQAIGWRGGLGAWLPKTMAYGQA
jgi:hypothetical protein